MPLRRQFLKSASLSVLTTPVLATPHVFANLQASRLYGITVLPEYVQSEGVEGVLKNLIDRAGVNAVTTSPYVMEPSDEASGSREPPIDAGAGSVRLLDRALFGKRELWVRTAPSFTPNRSLYQGLRYQPPEPDALTRREGGKVGEFIKQAKASGLKVYLQVQSASPPGYRVQFSGVLDEDQPRDFKNEIPPRRVDKNGSLASPHIVDYTSAMLVDLAQQYPLIDGFRIDWPEYPPYFLDALFLDYSVHAKAAAQRLGYAFDKMRDAAQRLHGRLFGKLTNRDLERVLEGDAGRFALMAGAIESPGFVDAMNFRVQLVRELIGKARESLNRAGAGHIELVPNAFPPPWNLMSGFPFGGWGTTISGFSVKQYAMHWAMMVRFYGDALLAANPGLDEQLLVKALVRMLDIADGEGLPHLTDYRYPEPLEAHPCGTEALKRKIRQTQASAGETPVYALAHGYGSAEDFRRRLTAANEASQHGFWINRYGYLSDEKLDIIRQLR
jgi:hypothetical protein